MHNKYVSPLQVALAKKLDEVRNTPTSKEDFLRKNLMWRDPKSGKVVNYYG